MESSNIPRKKIGSKFIKIGLILFPLLYALYIVSLHSNTLITKPISIIILVLGNISLSLLIVGIVLYFIGKDKIVRLKKGFRIMRNIFYTLWFGGAITVIVLLYVPSIKFDSWLITSAMTTMTHQYIASWFYDVEKIEDVMSNNTVMEVNEDTNTSLITITQPEYNKVTYENKFEREILTKEKDNDLYKIIDIDRDGYKGKLAVVYDPSKVIIGTAKNIGSTISNSYGQYLVDISKRYNAVIGLNASGFFDPGYNSTGGCARGFVISKGKLVVNNTWGRGYGGMVGFDKDNKLILSRTMTASQAISSGIRDAIQYGPFLVVNGKASYVKGNGGWGVAPRSAIGQRKDGIVLLLAIDGRQKASLGADMGDLAQIMIDYGAINAVNMDGGTSTSMTLNHKVITNPRNGGFQAKTRPIPDAWLVIK